MSSKASRTSLDLWSWILTYRKKSKIQPSKITILVIFSNILTGENGVPQWTHSVTSPSLFLKTAKISPVSVTRCSKAWVPGAEGWRCEGHLGMHVSVPNINMVKKMSFFMSHLLKFRKLPSPNTSQWCHTFKTKRRTSQNVSWWCRVRIKYYAYP